MASLASDRNGSGAADLPARKPVRSRRLVLIISCLCGLAILATASGLAWHLREAAIHRSDAEIGKLVHVLAEETARQFQTVDLALLAVEKELVDRLAPEEFADNARTDTSIDTLRRQIVAIPQLNSMFVIGADGAVLAGTRQGRELRVDLHDRDYFVSLRDDPALERFISAPVPNRVDGKWSIYAARRLAAPDGTFLGVVAASFALEYFEDLYRAIYLGPGSSIAISQGDGTLLARYPPLPDLIGREFKTTPALVESLNERESSVLHVFGGVSAAPIALAARRVPGYSLIATVTLTESAALADWYPQAAAIGGAAALALLALASIAWLLLRHLASLAIVDRETGARRELERSMLVAEYAIAEARASEARLRRSEEHLRRAQELGSIGSFERYFGSEEVSWSAETYRIFGVDPKRFDAGSGDLLAMVHEEDRERVRETSRKAKAGFSDGFEYRIVRPDGTIRLVRRTTAPIRSEAGKVVGMFGVLQDITEQRQFEVRLQLLQNVSLAIAEAADFDSALAIVLRAVCDSTQWAYGETWLPEGDGSVLGRGPVWHIDRPVLADYAAGRRSMKLGDRNGHIERAWRTRQPVWVPQLAESPWAQPGLVKRAQDAGIVSAFAVPIYAGDEVLAVARFATLERRERDEGLVEIIAAVAAQLGTALERKRIEQALRESEQMAREIVATAPDAFVQMDESGTILEWNPQAERLLGWTRAEALGRGAADLMIPVEQRPGFAEEMTRLTSAGSGRAVATNVLRRDGQPVEVERAVTALKRADGTVYNMFLRDLTDKLAVERQLRQAQKMEAVGNLTGGIAHDFNNLLGAIIGNLDLLELSLEPGTEAAELAQDAQQAALLGAELTRSLLAFARRQSLRPQPTDLNDLVGGLSKLLRRILGEQIDFSLNLAAEVRPVLVDPAQLESALTNLATNARDAMKHGGTLTVRTRNFAADQEYVALNPDAAVGTYAEIEVSDTGVGIAPEIMSRIFEPFFTTKEEGKGSGLGLSMVFGFVKQSGGHITVDSRAGEGTIMRLYLPHAVNALAEAPAPSARALARGGETIMVVEDNEKMRDVVVRQLIGLGYRVRAADTASTALELLSRDPAVDLLFTDIVMPGGMNGVELVRAVNAFHPGLRTVLTSGFSDGRLGSEDLRQLRSRLLGKPYRLEELARTIREVLDEPEASFGEAKSLAV